MAHRSQVAGAVSPTFTISVLVACFCVAVPPYVSGKEKPELLNPLLSDFTLSGEGLPNRPAKRIYLRLAQTGNQSFIVKDMAVEPAEEIPLNIELLNYNPDEYKFFMIKGLPEGFRMSAGFATKDAWLVSLGDVKDLRIIPRENFVGDLKLQFLLVKSNDNNPEQQILSVSIRPQTSSSVSATEAVPKKEIEVAQPSQVQAVQSAPAVAVQRRISSEEEEAAIERANKLLENSDISAARLIYESAAFKGSAKAAFAMGQTFDPQFLKRFLLSGLKPDLEEARKWYRKAIELGSSEAEARLATLDQRR